jgi:MFS family permease
MTSSSLRFIVSLWVRVILGAFLLVSLKGLFFGYAALKPIYINSNMYASLCNNHSTVLSNQHKNVSAVPLCDKQSLRMNMIMQVASAGTNSGALLIGVLIDLVNTRIVMTIGAVLWTLSILAFGLSSDTVPLYLPSVMMAVLTGAIMNMSLMKLKNYLTIKQGTIAIAIITSSWDMATLVSFIFNRIYFTTSVTMRQLFLAYSSLGIPMIFFSIVHKPFQFEMKNNHFQQLHDSEEEHNNNNNKKSMRDTVKDYVSDIQKSLNIEIPFLYATLMGQVLSMYFYMSTQTEQWRAMTNNSNTVYNLVQVYSVMLPLLGTLSFLVGVFKNLLPRPSLAFLYQAIMNIAWTVLSLIPVANLQYVTMTIFIIWRQGVFIIISDYFFQNYPKSCCFTMYLAGLTLAGIATLFNSLLNMLAVYTFHGNYLITNLIIAVLNIIPSVLVVVAVEYTYRKRLNQQVVTIDTTKQQQQQQEEMHDLSE